MPDPSDSTPPATKGPEGSPSEQSPEAAAGKSDNRTPPAVPVSLVPRSRAAAGSPRENAAPEGAPASFSDLMQWMKMFAAAADTAPAEPAKPGARLQRTTLPKEQRKFQRYDRESSSPDAPPAPVQTDAGTEQESRSGDEGTPRPSAPPPLDDEAESFQSGRPVPIALTGGKTGRRLKVPAPRRLLFWLWIQLIAVALIAASFLMGRASVPKADAPVRITAPAAPGSVADGSAGNVVSPEAAKIIDEAMAAEQDRKFGKAADLLLKVQKDFPHVRDLDFRLANIALEQNDAAKALPLLNQSIAEGEQAAASYKLRGTILNRKGGINRGMNDFETATQVDPFSAENFFFWGEALLRAGKPQAALVRMQEAMDRLREPSLEAQYRLEIRLTEIALGRESVFAPEMEQKLAENPPPPDWLLTAAAIALQHGDDAEAAKWLEKASTLMDKETFEMRMRNIFFFSHRSAKPLEKFFAFARRTPTVVPLAPDRGTAPADVHAPDAADASPGTPASSPAALPAGTP